MKRHVDLLALGTVLVSLVAACGGVTQNPDGGMSGAAGTKGSAGASGGAGTNGAAGRAGGAGTSGSAGTMGAAGRSGGAGTSGGGAGTTGVAGTSGGAGTNGAAGTTGAGGTSGGAGMNGGPCFDTVCNGTCKGDSCTGPWTCDTSAMICTLDLAEYCGCDRKTFQASGSCPSRAFAYRGACDPTAVSCDLRKVTCRRLAPNCVAGEVPEVVGTCYGECVPIASCRCAAAAECPAPDRYTCHMSAMRCGPFLN